MPETSRCAWAVRTDEERCYHDEEWGRPLHDERKLFEFLILEGAQAGLSWLTVLRKRERYREVFDGFDPEAVARYDAEKTAMLLADPGLIRNRLKIEAAVDNARAYLRVQETYGSFDAYLWRYVDGQPIQNAWQDYKEAPAATAVSTALSKDLRKRGFRFVGPTICYAYMQAVGLVNDHAVGCFRWHELGGGREELPA
ncbi:DNA-3-methyladenine glycosylase I [Methylococcus sp. EFPC2]|uniref:DNA-3-methyladenine glycosylase I n=1 Tax=Methylococcus sp. EFPC2 TaxID=2812648 RepID=UPI0019687C3C|nr:DNA-3-methyladenine glycosylase I [Methylococcus sp. EFPC2]QSA96980.1 DNA-3-methyladenine glycosylase I [Methylococcus sp. EFPC2]